MKENKPTLYKKANYKAGAHKQAAGSKARGGAPDKTRPHNASKDSAGFVTHSSDNKPERIAKVLARAGLCSRRDAEKWIEAGRVELNGKVLDSPAINVGPRDRVFVDGNPLPTREPTRLWMYYKPKGLVTTNRDPEGRSTIFEKMPEEIPRVMTVGRLDINTEGLLLLTNDGGLARILELPETGWLRRYRVRAHGRVRQSDLDGLKDGVVVEGVIYGAVEAEIDREQGTNTWINIGLREGKNREVKKILGHLGLVVNRLIRVSYGPFQLQTLNEGEVREVRGRVLRDQLGQKLIEKSGADFDARLEQNTPTETNKAPQRTGPSKGNGEKKVRPKREPKAHWSEDGGISAREARGERFTKGGGDKRQASGQASGQVFGKKPVRSASNDAKRSDHKGGQNRKDGQSRKDGGRPDRTGGPTGGKGRGKAPRNNR